MRLRSVRAPDFDRRLIGEGLAAERMQAKARGNAILEDFEPEPRAAELDEPLVRVRVMVAVTPCP